jgi:hypothetical protein
MRYGDPAGRDFCSERRTVSYSVVSANGSTPVAVSETINAIAIDPSLANSDIGAAAYVIQVGGTTIDFGNGFASTTGLTLNGSTNASNDSRLQLTDGGLNEAGSVFWNTPINIQAFTSQFTFQLSAAQANGFTFTIQNTGPTALGGDSAGLGYQNIQKSVAIKFNFYNYQNEGSDSTGFYTNGEPPLTPTVDISPSGIQLNSDDGITATVTYDGTTLTLNLLDGVTGDKFTYSQAINIPQTVGANTAYVGFTGGSGGLSASQKILSWTYTTQALPPAFTPAAGTYGAAQSVALSSGTSDAAIYYTTDGTTPTAGSTQYSVPISVGTSETFQAIAISPTMGTSTIDTAVYVIQTISGSGAFSLSATPTAAIAQGTSTTSTVTITPSGGFTGTVALTCAVSAGASGAIDIPTCSVSAPPAISGTTAVTSTLTINTQTTTSTGAYTVTVTGNSGGVSETTTVPLTIALPAVFTLSGTSAIVASPGMSTNSTITIAPSGGFIGTVAVTCTVTSSPAGAIDPPTCTASQPAAISGTAAVTSTLTINTTAPYTAALHNPLKRSFALGGGTLAALLIFCLPFRRRRWRMLFSLVVFAAITAGSIGCVSGVPANDPSNAGTTAGSYAITVTGTSGSAVVTTTVNLTVN